MLTELGIKEDEMKVLDEIDIFGLTLKKWVTLVQIITEELEVSSLDELDIENITSTLTEFLTKL